MITKSMAGVAAGVLLIGGGALATAQADPSPSAEPTRADSLTTSRTVTGQALAADESYPASVGTSTSISVRRTVQYGQGNVARVVVSPNGDVDSTPRGTVTVTVAGESRSASLSGGAAQITLPRFLSPGNYTARAFYSPAAGSEFRRSMGSDSYSVVKAGSRTSAQGLRTSVDERPTVRVAVESTTGVTPQGVVTVTISNGQRHTETERLTNGQAVVRFPKVDRRGQWDVRAVYGGSSTVTSSRGTDAFRVTR